MDFNSLIGYFSVVPTDWLILGAIAFVFMFLALQGGTGRLSSVALALLFLPTAALTLSKTQFIGGMAAGNMYLAFLGVIFVTSFFLIRRIHPDFLDESGQPVPAIAAGLATTIILTVTWVAIPEFTALWSFGDTVVTIFGEGYRLFWTLGGLLLFAFARG